MSTISFGNTVNHKQAATFIAANPRTRVLLRGEPGIGKSAVLKTVADMLGLPAIYVDVPNMDLGDIAMPVVDHATGTTKYYPNSRFQLQHGKPVVIMLDEFSKGADPVKNIRRGSGREPPDLSAQVPAEVMRLAEIGRAGVEHHQQQAQVRQRHIDCCPYRHSR
jgi:hypothetical protein